MASQNWHRDRILSNDFAYKVLRETAINEEGSYASEIARQLDKGGQEDTTRLLRKMLELDLVKKGKRTRAQYYKINIEGAERLFKELWRKNQVFENFNQFLEAYMHDYLIIYEDSTIEEMLQDHFLQGLHSYMNSENKIDNQDLAGLYEQLIMKKEVRASPQRFVETAAKALKEHD